MGTKKMDWTDEKAVEKLYGGYNDFPPNWAPMTEEQFVRGKFFTYHWEHTESRQMLPDRRDVTRGFVEATLFFYHDGSGLAVTRDYRAGKVLYFSFCLCEHDMEGLSQETCRNLGIYHGGMHYHVSKCRKCGYVNAVDSSG